MRIGWFALLPLMTISLSAPNFAQAKRHRQSEQTIFSAEDESVKKPVSIPEDVLAILRQDEMVRNVLEGGKIPADKIPSTWFSASVIHLANPTEQDLIVLGEEELRGANVIAFWVFRSTPHGHERVMMAHEHDLIVKRVWWKGYREIELMSSSAVEWSSVLLRWNGKEYVAYREKSGSIR